MSQSARDVEIRRVALHRRTQRENHLVDAALLHPTDERVDFKVGRPQSIHRRNDAAEHVVEAVELLRILHRHHVLNVFHDANLRAIAPSVAANRAHLAVADVVAHATVFHLALQPHNRLAEGLHVRRLPPQQVQRQAQCRFPPDARQFRKFRYRPLQ